MPALPLSNPFKPKFYNLLLTRSAVLIATFVFTGNASALGLMEAYEAALANDSVYRSALHENEAGQQFKVIGRSNLLPVISANYTFNRNNQNIDFGVKEEKRNYNSENGYIQLRQPIINLEGWARYHQGDAQTKLSDRQLAVRNQELITRFFGLFVTASYAEDLLALSQAERNAFQNQQEANKLLAARGEGTKTALIESQAKLSLSEVQIIESQDYLYNGRNALATMLGKEVTSLNMLSENFNALTVETLNVEEWSALALRNNPAIAAQRETVEIAFQEIKRNRAGHSPRLDAIANISKSDSDTTTTFKQNIDTRSIGLQLNIPIYAGGSVTALTTQAEANYKKAQDDLDSTINETLVELRKELSIVSSSSARIAAIKESVASAELLINATKKSLIGGVRTNLDVLDARRQLFVSKRDLSLARHNFLIAYLNLKKAAGTLTVSDLEKISTYFVLPSENVNTSAHVAQQD